MNCQHLGWSWLLQYSKKRLEITLQWIVMRKQIINPELTGEKHRLIFERRTKFPGGSNPRFSLVCWPATYCIPELVWSDLPERKTSDRLGGSVWITALPFLVGKGGFEQVWLGDFTEQNTDTNTDSLQQGIFHWSPGSFASEGWEGTLPTSWEPGGAAMRAKEQGRAMLQGGAEKAFAAPLRGERKPTYRTRRWLQVWQVKEGHREKQLTK